jgi:hypothetical protein
MRAVSSRSGRPKQPPTTGTPTPRRAAVTAALQGLPDRSEEDVVVDRLRQEIDGPFLHGSDALRDVAVARQEERRQLDPARGQRVLERQAVETRHRNVQDDASFGRRIDARQELFGRSERGRLETGGTEEPGQGLENGGFVVDEIHALHRGFHASPRNAGRVK